MYTLEEAKGKIAEYQDVVDQDKCKIVRFGLPNITFRHPTSDVFMELGIILTPSPI